MAILLHFFIALLRNAYFFLISVDPKSTLHQILLLFLFWSELPRQSYVLCAANAFFVTSLCATLSGTVPYRHNA
jgi:hypothetical protein